MGRRAVNPAKKDAVAAYADARIGMLLRQRLALLDEVGLGRLLRRRRKTAKRFAKWLRLQEFVNTSDERFRLDLISWLES